MTTIQAQDLPYQQIPEAPESVHAGGILSRMMDGLGFRYYWATEGLTDKDLAYKPSEDSRTIAQTLDHIYQLAATVATTAKGEAIEQPRGEAPADFAALRQSTLLAIETASKHFKSMKDDTAVEETKIQFKRGERVAEFPIWNLLNGPLADAIYHTGQIVAFRRAAGNPMPSGVNVFRGTRKE